MCIACELGYWSMVDALDTERAASKKKAGTNDPVFACEVPAERPKRKRYARARQSTDEPAP
jgi:hypothetical protein